MRIAALALTVLAFAACIWFAVPAMLGCFMLAFLALANGAGTLQLYRQRRPGALWLVLIAGLMLLGSAIWHFLASLAMMAAELDRLHVSAADEQRDFFLRALLTGAGVGLSAVGWLAWLVNRRITIDHGRD